MKMTSKKMAVTGAMAWMAGVLVPGLGAVGLGLAVSGMVMIAAGSVMEGRLS